VATEQPFQTSRTVLNDIDSVEFFNADSRYNPGMRTGFVAVITRACSEESLQKYAASRLASFAAFVEARAACPNK
jgi:hypothetical protein